MKAKIQFARQDQALLHELNTRVNQYFDSRNIDKKGNGFIHAKALVIFLLYGLASLGIYFSSNLLILYSCYLALGPLTVFLALNVGHEAAHNIFCRSKRLNSLLVNVFDLLGASGQIWKYKHVHSHHLHANIYQVDLELKQPSIIRIFPQSAWKNIHRFQHIYMPVLYSIYTLIWFCFRDYRDYFLLKDEVIKSGQSKHFTFRFFMGKFLFLSRFIVMPILILPFAWYHIVGGFILMSIVSSVTVTFALISTHVGEHTEFPEPDASGQMSHSWVRHQFKTTSDFATDNKLVTALYGGFNHHLTHHLFPFISHAHYPVVTRIIKEVSEAYQVSIFPQPTIWAAMKSHFILLKRRGSKGKETLEWMEM